MTTAISEVKEIMGSMHSPGQPETPTPTSAQPAADPARYRSFDAPRLPPTITSTIPVKGAGESYQGYAVMAHYAWLDRITDLAAEVIKMEPEAAAKLLKTGSPAQLEDVRKRLEVSNGRVLGGFTQNLLIANVQDAGLLFAGMYNAGFTGHVRNGQTFRDLAVLTCTALRAISGAPGRAPLAQGANPMNDFIGLPVIGHSPFKFEPTV